MCGITGTFSINPSREIDREAVAAMTASLLHRGPDAGGIRMGPGYGLGHRRLAIVDLAQGDQPMSDASGKVWVTYNGEIYNHESLRRELVAAGHEFVTSCDTEVLVHGYREWGTDLVRRLRGM